MRFNYLVALVNLFLLVVLSCITFNSIKNIDNHADALIKLSGCEHTMRYQDQVLRELLALEHIIEED
jgi:hypothetical protein